MKTTTEVNSKNKALFLEEYQVSRPEIALFDIK